MYAQTERQGRGSIKGFVETGITSVPGSASVRQALQVMVDSGSSVVMVAEGEEVMGLLTAGDIGSMVVRDVDLDRNYVRDFAALCRLSGDQPCVRVDIGEDPLNVLKVMENWGIDRVLVTKEEKVVGTISALGALKGWMEKV